MNSTQELIAALNAYSTQLPNDVLDDAALEHELAEAAFNLVLNLKGATEVARSALQDGREKRQYELIEDDDASESEGIADDDDSDREETEQATKKPRYKTWKDESGRIMYKVLEVLVLFSGGPMSCIQHVVIKPKKFSKHLAISAGFSGNISQNMICDVANGASGEVAEICQLRDRSIVARFLCFDHRLGLGEGAEVDVVASKHVASVRSEVHERTWMGKRPKTNDGVTCNLLMQSVSGWYRIPYQDGSLGSQYLHLSNEHKIYPCNTFSVESRMGLDVFAYLETPVDLSYRLSGWASNATPTLEDLENRHLGFAGRGGNSDDDEDDNGDGLNRPKPDRRKGGCTSLKRLRKLRSSALVASQRKERDGKGNGKGSGGRAGLGRS